MPEPSSLSAFDKAARLWRTVRHLKPQQIIGRVRFRLARPRIDASAAPMRRAVLHTWQCPAQREPSLIGSTRFRFLNEEADLGDHGWDDPALSKLWRYNLHYFDDLNALSASERRGHHAQLLARWIAENPPAHGSGWEPYPTSLRIVNWVKYALSGVVVSELILHSLAVQARWLSARLEWHLLGNHLFANAKALIFAGLFFEGDEADTWFDTGAAILRRELPEQILSDGGQFELSPMYHAIALDDVLDLINLARAFRAIDLEAEVAAYVPQMLDWLAAMSHPCGQIAFFNDAALKIAPDNFELENYARRLGFEPQPVSKGLIHLEASGYVRAANAAAVLIADTAQIGPDYLPGHAHADTLSFELSLGGRRVITNSGTSVYGLGAERLRQRGTAAHSTLVIDGENSSEVWSGFRVGRRARCLGVVAQASGDRFAIEASHDGYIHLPGRPRHHRQWSLAGDSLIVSDTVSGSGRHALDTYFRLPTGLKAEAVSSDHARISDENGDEIACLAAEGSDLEVVSTTWHPQFGLNQEAVAIVARYSGPIPHQANYTISWKATCGS